MMGAKSSELMMDEMKQPKSGGGKKRKGKHSEPEEAVQLQPSVDSAVFDAAGSSDQSTAVRKPTFKRSRRGKPSPGNLEKPTNVDGRLNTRKESGVRGRNKGWGRGRGRGQRSQTGRRAKNSFSTKSETSYNVGSSSNGDEEIQFGRTEESQEVRKSSRLRNTVNYTFSSDESDSDDTETKNSLREGLTVEEPFVDQSIGGINEKTDRNDLSSNIGINGIFVDEMEQPYTMDQTNDCQIEEPLNQNLLSKDYLQFGGGFCVEEEEEEGQQIESLEHAPSPTRQTETETIETGTTEIDPQKSDAPECSDHETKETHEIGKPYVNKNGDGDNPANDSVDYNGGSFRAMPNLRRKRRRT